MGRLRTKPITTAASQEGESSAQLEDQAEVNPKQGGLEVGSESGNAEVDVQSRKGLPTGGTGVQGINGSNGSLDPRADGSDNSSAQASISTTGRDERGSSTEGIVGSKPGDDITEASATGGPKATLPAAKGKRGPSKARVRSAVPMFPWSKPVPAEEGPEEGASTSSGLAAGDVQAPAGRQGGPVALRSSARVRSDVISPSGGVRSGITSASGGTVMGNGRARPVGTARPVGASRSRGAAGQPEYTPPEPPRGFAEKGRTVRMIMGPRRLRAGTSALCARCAGRGTVRTSKVGTTGTFVTLLRLTSTHSALRSFSCCFLLDLVAGDYVARPDRLTADRVQGLPILLVSSVSLLMSCNGVSSLIVWTACLVRLFQLV